MVGLSGFEPLTSRLSGVRSNQLSYRPEFEFKNRNFKFKIANLKITYEKTDCQRSRMHDCCVLKSLNTDFHNEG